MCRLLAYAAAHPTRIRDVITDGQCATFQRLGRLHDDGWGSAWVADSSRGPVVVRNRAVDGALDDVRLARALRRPRSRARLFHLRLATGSLAVQERNTHPFLADGIALAHNGSIFPTDRVLARLRPGILADVEGDTDSELYLALVRQHARDGADVPTAVTRAVADLRSDYPRASLNAVLLTAQAMIVVHASTDAAVPWLELDDRGIPADDLPLGHDESYYRMSMRREADGTVAFASSGLDTTGWEPLPLDSVTTVDLATMALRTTDLASGVEATPAVLTA
ncbi:class II glutamine amidotransferase [Agilicoccus flavus]|uniref:class II glutamine amidotransferase n=1 Tax=Agilicoccus flavus TaxID=2775968 RepID=UPI001CF65EA9|nr:class II glutamine amidotransferase [Agilicoccus flavus]